MVKAGDVMQVHGYYIVVGTHPKQPNHDGHARGRVQHYAASIERGTLTLCNMMVSSPYRAWNDSLSARDQMMKPCVVCLAKVKMMRSKSTAKIDVIKKVPVFKYGFTINTDASFSEHHGGIAAFGCWIRSSHYLIKKAGLLPDGTANSSVAELLAIEQALIVLNDLINAQDFLQTYQKGAGIRLHFNTDSKFAIAALDGTMKKTKHLPVVSRVRALTEGFDIRLKHVKSHDGVDTSRKWVNDWCDKQAKQLVRERRAELNARAN